LAAFGAEAAAEAAGAEAAAEAAAEAEAEAEAANAEVENRAAASRAMTFILYP
jgi:hypothetical protein